MNLENETIRCLQQSISQYERMSMLSNNSSEKWEYKRKADKCRDELNILLKKNGEY